MEKKLYTCTILLDASNGQTVVASSPEEAAGLAQDAAIEDGAGSLCHYCSRHTDVGDIYGVVVYDDDNEVLNTVYHAEREKSLQGKIDALQQRLNAVEEENDRLRSALKFYADKEHFYHGDDKWDSVSGEPSNVLWHEEEPYSVEDGWFARKALEKRP